MIKGTIAGDKEVVSRLTRMPSRLKAGLQATITRLCLALLIKVKQDKLSGQVLQVQSGRLRRSITQEVTTGVNAVSGVVGTNVAYARRFELGFTGTENVKEHLRMMTKAWGKEVKEPHKITVHAFARKVNVPARSFLGSALKEMGPEIISSMDDAVKKALQ